jgi:hypothetical protein
VIENDTPTKKKLRETMHFLRELRHDETQTTLDSENFDFNLSAFFSAGRSVTFVLQKENKVGYDAWFPLWLSNRSQADRDLFDFMKRQRNVVVKEEGTSDHERVIELVDQRLTEDYQTRRQHPSQMYMSLGFEGAKVGVARHYFTIDEKKLSVLEVCSAYAALLTELVEAFYSRFPR